MGRGFAKPHSPISLELGFSYTVGKLISALESVWIAGIYLVSGIRNAYRDALRAWCPWEG